MDRVEHFVTERQKTNRLEPSNLGSSVSSTYNISMRKKVEHSQLYLKEAWS